MTRHREEEILTGAGDLHLGVTWNSTGGGLRTLNPAGHYHGGHGHSQKGLRRKEHRALNRWEWGQTRQDYSLILLHEGARMEQKRHRGGFVKKTVCEIGLEDWAVWDVEVGEQSQGGWKYGAEEKRHKV